MLLAYESWLSYLLRVPRYAEAPEHHAFIRHEIILLLFHTIRVAQHGYYFCKDGNAFAPRIVRACPEQTTVLITIRC